MSEEKKDNCELQSVKEEVAKRAGHGTWEHLLEQDSYDHSNMMGHWQEVARMLSSRINDFRMIALSEVKHGGRWIKVKDAIPAPARGYVLVYGDGEFDLAEYNGLIWRKGRITALSGITHWMPFDYPEKEEAEIITKGL
jgi:hypothetical protein